MKAFFARLWSRIRHKRRIDADRAGSVPLREFVYLDDVSVYSLLTSRQGALATEFTDTAMNSRKSELSGAVRADVKLLKSDLSSKLESTESMTSQVLRKSTIQAAFKEFYEGEEGRLAIAADTANAMPQATSWAAIEEGIGSPQFEGWLFDVASLERGQLVEIEVLLGADAIYRVSAMVSAIHGIIEEFSGQISVPGITEMAALNRVLDKMLVGLVPLRGSAVDIVVVRTGERTLLVRRELLNQLDASERPGYSTLAVAGVAEQRLFWKDSRRVLFSASQFRLLCRLNHGEVQKGWVPVKLLDVLGELSPDLARAIDDLGKSMLTLNSSLELPGSEPAHQMVEALIEYGRALAEESNEDIDLDGLTSFCNSMSVGSMDLADVKIRRQVFDEVSRFVLAKSTSKPDPVTAARLRTAALLDAGLGLDGQARAARDETTVPVVPHDEFILDTEIVAIYW